MIEIMEKYSKYNVTFKYFGGDLTIYIREPIPVTVFTLLRADLERLHVKASNIIVGGRDVASYT